MSRFVMIAFGVGLAIVCVIFACLLKWHERTSWGWFLLAGLFFWSTAVNEYKTRMPAPMFDTELDLLANGKPSVVEK